MRNPGSISSSQRTKKRSTATTLVALAGLLAAWLYAPFVHAHHDDGLHSMAGNFIHAHVPDVTEHHDSEGPELEENGLEHGRSVNTFTVEVFDFHHIFADVEDHWVSIELKEDWLFRPLAFPRSHGPPLTGSSTPRSPPKSFT